VSSRSEQLGSHSDLTAVEHTEVNGPNHPHLLHEQVLSYLQIGCVAVASSFLSALFSINTITFCCLSVLWF